MKKFKKPSVPKIVLLLFLISNFAQAQVGIGTTMPEPSTVLDISSSEKRVIVPRVNITDLTQEAPITGGASEGLLVWNTNSTTGIGFHYWDGNDWIPITTGTSTNNWA